MLGDVRPERRREDDDVSRSAGSDGPIRARSACSASTLAQAATSSVASSASSSRRASYRMRSGSGKHWICYASFYPAPRDWERLVEDLGLADKRNLGVRQALGRPEAAAVGRAGPDRQSEDRHPRRAHDRPGSTGQARHVAAHRGRPRRRRHGGPGHPLHGGGRAAGRSDRAHRRWPRRGSRYAGRDRVPGRRRAATQVPAVHPDRRWPPVRAARGSGRHRDGSTVVVAGTGNLVQTVMTALARQGVVATTSGSIKPISTTPSSP